MARARPVCAVSLHDVTPFHLDRLVRAERFLVSLGVTRVAYLLVPRFHGAWAVDEHDDFVAWCRATRPFEVEWLLHGFFHSELVRPGRGGRPPGIAPWFKSSFLTDREGEFLALRGEELRQRIARGVEVFRSVLGAEAVGFVPPAWLFNDELLPALHDLGFSFAEDHGGLYDVQEGRRVRSPVITWATRTLLRRYGSLVVCPLLQTLWNDEPAIRIAVHPSDFDHPRTVRSIERILRAAMRDRDLVSCHSLALGAGAAGT